jgi:hypothetical protein
MSTGEADLRPTNLTGGVATLLSSQAGDPRAVTGDTTHGGQAQADSKYLSQPVTSPGPHRSGRTSTAGDADDDSEASISPPELASGPIFDSLAAQLALGSTQRARCVRRGDQAAVPRRIANEGGSLMIVMRSGLRTLGLVKLIALGFARFVAAHPASHHVRNRADRRVQRGEAR